MKNLFILGLAAAALLYSCQKKTEEIIEPPAPKETVCRMTELKSTKYDYSYTYTVDGDHYAVSSAYKGQSAEGDFYSTYEYVQGVLTTIIAYYDEAKTIPLRKILFKKDTGKVEMNAFQYHHGGLKQTSRLIQLLDENGKLLKEESFTYLDGTPVPNETVEYTTDENGNPIRAYRYYNGDLTGTTSFTYDKQKNLNLALPEYTVLKTGKNNVLKSVYEDKFGQTVTTNFTYQYDSEGYPVSSSDGRTFSYSCR